MAIAFNDNIRSDVNRPLDFKMGPFLNIAQANSLIPIEQRYQGLIFAIYTNPLDINSSDVTHYYYYDALSDTDYKPLFNLELIESDSNIVKFDKISGYVHGNAGAITISPIFDFSLGIRGVVNYMTYNSSTLTLPIEGVIIAGYFSPNVNNYITFELINKTSSNEVVWITISQDVY